MMMMMMISISLVGIGNLILSVNAISNAIKPMIRRADCKSSDVLPSVTMEFNLIPGSHLLANLIYGLPCSHSPLFYEVQILRHWHSTKFYLVLHNAIIKCHCCVFGHCVSQRVIYNVLYSYSWL